MKAPPPERQCVATSKRTGERCTAWAVRDGVHCSGHAGKTSKAHLTYLARRRDPASDVSKMATVKSELQLQREERWRKNTTPPPLTDHDRAEGWRWVPERLPEDDFDIGLEGLFRDKHGAFCVWRKVPGYVDDQNTIQDQIQDAAAQRDIEADRRIEAEWRARLDQVRHVRGMSPAQIEALPPEILALANMDPRMFPAGRGLEDIVEMLIANEQQGIPVDIDSDDSDAIVGQIVREAFRP